MGDIARSRKSRRPHLGGDVRRSVLPNGLRVVTEDMPGSHTFSLGWFVGVGSRHEPAGLYGAAHFLEHMLFKGTPNARAEELAARFDGVGGDINAYTSKEHTCFYCRVMSDDAEMAVDTLQEMLTSSILAEPDFESERSIILDEISMHVDDPSDYAGTLAMEAMYPGHAMGRDVIGSVESVSALRREDVLDFWRHYFVPDNIVVAAAGDVDHGWLCDKLTGLGSGERAPIQERIAPVCPDDACVCTELRPTEQTSCLMVFPGLPLFAADECALSLLSLILGGGMSSRLFVEVRERRGWAYHIDAGAGSYSDTGHFVIDWQSAPNLVPDIVALVRDTIVDIVTDGVTEAELSRAKGLMRGQTLLGFESPRSRMMRLGRTELNGDKRSVDEMLDRFEAVTQDQVGQIAHTILRHKPVISMVGAYVDPAPIQQMCRDWIR